MSASRKAPNDGSIVYTQVRKTYTGKLYGRQDDLIIALQLAIIGCQKFFQGAARMRTSCLYMC